MKRKVVNQSVVLFVLLSWICLSYFACEWTPERDNPLDPNSELYHPPSPGSITGEVRNLSGTSPLSGVMVNLESGSQGVVTAFNGKYLIEDVADGQHWVKVHKEGYVDDSTQATVITGAIDTVDFRMNALPLFDSVSVTLHRIYLGTSYNELVTVYTRITDFDMNISTFSTDTAILALFEADTLGRLNSSAQSGDIFTFNRDFQISEFHLGNTQDIVGRPFTLVAMDQANGVSISSPYSVVRFIQDVPAVISPNYVTVPTSYPTLVWSYYGATFSYLQNARIFNNSHELVWDSLSIDPLATQVTVNDPLPPTGIEGNPSSYYWNLEIVDLFGNSICSINLTFWVLP